MKDPRSFAPSSFSLSCVAAAGLAALVSVGCMGPAEDPTSGSGGAKGSGGAVGSGGANVPAGSGGASAPAGSGGMVGSGGATGSGGASSMGSGGANNTGSGGRAGMGGGAGRQGSGGAAGGGAGRGGAPGSGGTMGGSAGAGGGSGTAPMASAGCGKMATQTLGRWVDAGSVMAGTSSRPYSVYLPTGYDPMRSYPLIVLLHGCGGGTNNVPMEGKTGSDAILIRGTGSASGTCWDANATGSDVAFFDAMVADAKARFCTDTKRVFVVGYSSGSWLVNQLTCIRSTVVRGAGTVAGGESARGNCTGPVSHMFFHDMGDPSNRIADSEKARDRLLTQNGCDKSAMPMAQQPSPCVRYQCPPGYPVVWCPTTGQNHNRQDNVVPGALWTFFKEF